MSINKFRSNLLILPEDDAYRQIANGFLIHPDVNANRVQVMPVLGGWVNVRIAITSDYSVKMSKYTETHLVALIDLDGQANRMEEIKADIPNDFADRIYILGISLEAENLKSTLNMPYESIGRALAADCHRGLNDYWGCELLAANAPEISRLKTQVCPFLFK